MANTLDFTINLNDLLSTKLDKIGTKLDGVDKKLNDIGEKGKKGFNSMKESADAFGNTLGRIESIAKGLIATFIAFKAFDFIKDTVKEYRELNNQQVLFNQQLKNSGIYSEELVKNLKDRRDQLNALGFVDDVDQIKMQRDLMKNYSGSNSSFQNDYQTATADIAASKGTDLTAAGSMLDKALRGAAKGLNELLGRDQMVEYQKAFKLMQKQGLDADTARLEAIKKLYAGDAEDLLKNSPQRQFAVAVDNIQDTLRDKLGPILDNIYIKLTPLLTALNGWINTNIVQITKSLKFISELLVAIGIKLVATNIIEGLENLRIAMIGLSAATITISGVVGIITTVGFALYELYQHSEDFKKGIDGIWDTIKKVFDDFKTSMDNLINYFDKLSGKNKKGGTIFEDANGRKLGVEGNGNVIHDILNNYGVTKDQRAISDQQRDASDYRSDNLQDITSLRNKLESLHSNLDVFNLGIDALKAGVDAMKNNQNIVDAINKVRGIAPSNKNGAKSGAVPPKSGAASEDVTSKVTGQSVTHINFNYTGDMVRFGTIEIRSNTSDEGAEELATKVQNIVINAIAQGIDAGQRTAGTNE